MRALFDTLKFLVNDYQSTKEQTFSFRGVTRLSEHAVVKGDTDTMLNEEASTMLFVQK